MRHFERDLNQLREKLALMAGFAMSNVYLAIKTLVDRNADRVAQIFAQEQRVNSMQVEIDNFCLELIALHQPVAADLRLLAAAMKITTELERIADQTINITQAALQLIKQPQLKPLVDIPRMADLVQHMVKDALDGFVRKDSLLARDVLKRDDDIDELKDRCYVELLDVMRRDKEAIATGMQLIFVSRNLERIADHATNIAEDVVYLVEGIDVRHHSESTQLKTDNGGRNS